MLKPTFATLVVSATVLTTPAGAADPAAADQAPSAVHNPQPNDSESLAKKLSNPIASLISVPFQLNADFGGGATDDGDKYTLNIQPVIPISISSGTTMIVRTIVPVVHQEKFAWG